MTIKNTMESDNNQFNSIEELLNSDDAKFLPNRLKTFFSTAKNYTPLSAVELAIKAYKEGNNTIKTALNHTVQQDNIEELLTSNEAAKYIPQDFLKALNTGKNFATPEIIEDLIYTFKIISDQKS